jgi:amino acid transporter/nucleotide-binding universal stress UspA family protein
VLEIALRRDLGLFDTTMIGIGTMIGASIFSLAAVTVGIAGPGVLLSIIIAGGICFLTASTYAQLGGLLQEAGGGYLWVRQAFSRGAGFTAGWISWFGHSVACAFYIVIFAGGIQFLLSEIWPGTTIPVAQSLFGAAVAALFVAINDRGTVLTARTEAVVTIAQLVVFAVFSVTGLVLSASGRGLTADPFGDFLGSGWWSILVAAGVLAIAFEGYEVVAQSAEETKRPEKTIPRAIYISIIVVTGLYLLLVGTAVLAEGPAQVAARGDESLIRAGDLFLPQAGAFLMIGALLAGALSALNATIFSASRVAFAMGRDRTLPKAFGTIHRRRRTPYVAIRVSGVAIIATALFVPLQDIAAAAGIMFLLLFIMVNASFIRLRRTDERVRAKFPSARSDIKPAVAIAGKVVVLVPLASYSPLALTIAVAWSALGAVVYVLLHRGREGPAPAVAATGYAREGPTIPAERFHVLVPAASPREKRIVEMASMVARASEGHVSIMRVIPVPRATPIWAAADMDNSFDLKMVEGLMGFAGPGVDASAALLVSHDIEGAIAEKAREDNVNLIFIGWRGSTKTRKAIFGGTVDALLARAPCDVAVVRTRLAWQPSEFRRIALLSGPHRHVRPAADLAAALTRDPPATVTVLRVVGSERERQQPDDDVEALVEHLHRLGLDTTVRTIVNRRTASAVIGESDRFDLLILGSPPGLLRKVIARRGEEEVAKSSKCPIVLYRHRGATATDFLRPIARTLGREAEEPASLPVSSFSAREGRAPARRKEDAPAAPGPTETPKSDKPGASNSSPTTAP